MNITLYKNSAEQVVVDKTNFLTQVVTYNNIVLKGNTNIINPTIILVDSISILQYNYAYIEEFNRYYFVVNITIINNNHFEVELKEDVLMSFNDLIRQQTAWISRTADSNYINLKIKDNLMPFETIPEISINKIGQLYIFNPQKYAMVVSIYAASSEISGKADGVDTTSQSVVPNSGLNPLRYDIYTYLLTNDNDIKLFLNNLRNNLEQMASYISSIKLYPIQESSFNVIDNSGTPFQPTSQMTWSDGNGGQIVLSGFTNLKIIKPTAILEENIILSIPIYLSTFDDLSPYTTYEIYLPLYGYVELQPTDIIQQKLKLRYSVDLSTGKCLIQLIRYNSTTQTYDTLINSFEIYFASPLPINTTNQNEVERNKVINAIGIMTSIVGLTTSIATGSVGGFAGALLSSGENMFSTELQLQSLKTQQIMKGVGGLVSTGMNYIANEVSNVEKGFVEKCESITNKYKANNGIYLKIAKHKRAINDYTNYKKLNGMISKKIVILDNITGFTMIDDIHLENFDNATSTEIDMIYELLRTGVIL